MMFVPDCSNCIHRRVLRKPGTDEPENVCSLYGFILRGSKGVLIDWIYPCDMCKSRGCESFQMRKVEDIHSRQPHKISEVICVHCGKRWIAVRPVVTKLKDLECENCGSGFVIETGEELEKE